MIGLWSYYNASSDPEAKAYIEAWGKSYNYELCSKGSEYSEFEFDENAARRRLQVTVGDTVILLSLPPSH